MLTTQELLSSSGTTDWVIHQLLPVGGKMMLGGPPKAGKSLLTLKLAHAILREPLYHGFKVESHGTVLMLENDMPRSSHKRRIEKLHGVYYDFGGMYHITKDLMPNGFNLLDEPHYNWLAEQVRDLRPTVIIFDVLRSFYLGDENNSEIVSRLMSRIDALLLEGDSSCVIIHHSKKSGFDKETGHSLSPVEALRGSTVIAGSMDTICALNDSGTMVQYQGRDIGNITYHIHQEFGGLKNRYIRKGATNRSQSLERLYALLLSQNIPDPFSAMAEYCEQLDREEFEAARSVVGSNVDKYLWS